MTDAANTRDAKAVAIVTSIHPDFDSRIWKHATSVAKAGVPVYLICPWNVAPFEERDGVTFVPFPKAGSRRSRPFVIPPRVYARLWKIRDRVGLIHFHDIDLLPWLSFLSWWRPVVYDVHENYADEMLVRSWIPGPMRKPLYYMVKYGQAFFSQIVRNIVLVTPYQEKDFNKGRVRRIYVKNYATLKLLDSVADDHEQRPPGVVFIGSQHRNNGSLLLLDIAERTLAEQPDITFYASDRFGDPKFRELYVAEAERRQLGDRLVLLPNVLPHKLMTVLNRATIAINPNLRVDQQIKGIHTKLFEFMAAGLPIVTSDLPHQVEVIEKSGAGVLARPEDPDSFVKPILELTRDRDLAREYSARGRAAFREHYCWESQVPALLDFYRQIAPGLLA